MANSENAWRLCQISRKREPLLSKNEKWLAAFVKKSGEEGGFVNNLKTRTRRLLVPRSKIGEQISVM